MNFSDFEQFFYVFYRQVLFVAVVFQLVSALFLAVTTVLRSVNEA